MKIAAVVILALVGGTLLFGCGLTSDQIVRLDQITQENESLKKQVDAVIQAAKDGKLTAADVISVTGKLYDQIDANLKEVKKIKDEGGSPVSAWIILLISIFGRTVLHGASTGLASIPGAGPAATLLSVLLGGSKGAQPNVDPVVVTKAPST